MNVKILSFLFLSVFLFSLVSAVTVYSDFSTGSQTEAINVNQQVSFNVDFFSMNPPMTIKAQIYQGNNLIYTFLNTNTNANTYYNTFLWTPNSSQTGIYEIKVIGTDEISTDSEFLTLIVNSVSPGNNAPTITILGNNPQDIEVGSDYIDAGATANDTEDGNLTSQIIKTGTVNTNTLGTYILLYSVTDSDNNIDVETRIVNVVDTTNPAITILGANPQIMKQGTSYVELGATASDNYNGNLTANITISSNVNISVLGTYNVTYSVTDSSGNSATSTRIVNVVDNLSPIFTNPLLAQQFNEGTNYNLQVNATDAENDTIIYSMTGAPSQLSINSSTGLITGTLPSVSSNANYNITITISDGLESNSQTYVLTVVNAGGGNNGGGGGSGTSSRTVESPGTSKIVYIPTNQTGSVIKTSSSISSPVLYVVMITLILSIIILTFLLLRLKNN